MRPIEELVRERLTVVSLLGSGQLVGCVHVPRPSSNTLTICPVHLDLGAMCWDCGMSHAGSAHPDWGPCDVCGVHADPRRLTVTHWQFRMGALIPSLPKPFDADLCEISVILAATHHWWECVDRLIGAHQSLEPEFRELVPMSLEMPATATLTRLTDEQRTLVIDMPPPGD